MVSVLRWLDASMTHGSSCTCIPLLPDPFGLRSFSRVFSGDEQRSEKLLTRQRPLRIRLGGKTGDTEPRHHSFCTSRATRLVYDEVHEDAS